MYEVWLQGEGWNPERGVPPCDIHGCFREGAYSPYTVSTVMGVGGIHDGMLRGLGLLGCMLIGVWDDHGQRYPLALISGIEEACCRVPDGCFWLHGVGRMVLLVTWTVLGGCMLRLACSSLGTGL